MKYFFLFLVFVTMTVLVGLHSGDGGMTWNSKIEELKKPQVYYLIPEERDS